MVMHVLITIIVPHRLQTTVFYTKENIELETMYILMALDLLPLGEQWKFRLMKMKYIFLGKEDSISQE